MKNKDSKFVLGHKITPLKVSGNYDLVLGETPAHVSGPPPHSHLGLEEVFLVTEGEMEFVIDGTTRTLKAGESLDLPRGTVHTFRNISNTKCCWVNIHSPKGFLSFFEDIGISTNEEDAIRRSVDQSIIDRVMATAANYDMHIKL
jgi:mannose-6-phosphate isomerase-like protein (cupin superfamily)